MPVYNGRCNECNCTYEWTGPSHQAPGVCVECGSEIHTICLQAKGPDRVRRSLADPDTAARPQHEA
jgi:hypothetical protein